jgi:hypothetical protein
LGSTVAKHAALSLRPRAAVTYQLDMPLRPRCLSNSALSIYGQKRESAKSVSHRHTLALNTHQQATCHSVGATGPHSWHMCACAVRLRSMTGCSQTCNLCVAVKQPACFLNYRTQSTGITWTPSIQACVVNTVVIMPMHRDYRLKKSPKVSATTCRESATAWLGHRSQCDAYAYRRGIPPKT